MKKRMKVNWLVCVLCVALMCIPHFRVQTYAADSNDSAISIALDVSGSMKDRDPDRVTIELLKMLVDVCQEGDYLNITAYNDSIVYSSGLLDMGLESSKKAMKEALDNISYEGYTDNGLGLKTATQAIVDAKKCEQAFVILISDGDTYLSGNRLVEDSNEDMKESSRLAVEQGIRLHIVEYTGNFSTDTNLMSVATSATGGGTTVVDNQNQFIQVLLSVFFSEYHSGKMELGSIYTEEVLNRLHIPCEQDGSIRKFYYLFSSEELSDFELIKTNCEIPYVLEKNYVVAELTEVELENLQAIYTLKSPAEVYTGLVRIRAKEKVQPVVEVQESLGKIPMGFNRTVEVYTSKNMYQIDVSSMFADEDQDIVSYELKGIQDVIVSLSGSMLSVDVSKGREEDVEIVATDSKGNATSAILSMNIIPAWKVHYELIVGIVILIIIFLTAILCIWIVRKLLFSHSKVRYVMEGVLKLQFIDLKSRYESKDLCWELSPYPEKGVTLLELFREKRIAEDLKDLDKVVFRPTQNPNVIELVHNIEGGAFLGEELIRAKVPAKIKYGDTVFLSFADNSSELAIRYEKSGK